MASANMSEEGSPLSQGVHGSVAPNCQKMVGCHIDQGMHRVRWGHWYRFKSGGLMWMLFVVLLNASFTVVGGGGNLIWRERIGQQRQ